MWYEPVNFLAGGFGITVAPPREDSLEGESRGEEHSVLHHIAHEL